MKHVFFSLIALLNLNPLLGQQVNSSGDNSPAVIAQNFSVTYGVRADAVEAILWIYEADGYDLERRKRATEQIIREYTQSPEKQQEADALTEATRSKMNPKVADALEWDLFARKYYLSTSGYNSPAVVAKGDVNIWYGIPAKALRALAAQLEKNKANQSNLSWQLEQNKIELDNFEAQLADQVKKYGELKAELEAYGGQEEIYKKAEALLEEGRLQEAEQLIEADYRASKKRQAYKGYVFGKTKELNLKYAEAAEGFRDAVFLDNVNSTYHLYYADNEITLGHYEEAIKHFEIALGIDSLKSGNGERMATLLEGLGSAWLRKGGYDKAIEYHEKSLQIRLTVLGENHPYVALSYNNLGNAWASKGGYDTAIGYLEKSLGISLKTMGKNHLNVALSYNNLGNAWYSKGEYDKAIGYYEKSIQIFLTALGENHPNFALCYGNLGNAWASKGEYDKAIGHYEKSLQILLKAFGGNHPDVAMNYYNLGKVWFSKREYDKAIGYQEKSLQIRLKALGENHPDVARSYYILGFAWAEKASYDTAIGYLEKVLQISLKTLGENHPDVALGYNALGYTWYLRADYDKAIIYYEKALQIRLKVQGETHPDVVLTYYILGYTWHSRDEYGKAIIYYEKALQSKGQIGEALVRQIQYSKLGCLKRLRRDKEAETLAQELWQEGLKFNDIRLLDSLKKEGYNFGGN